MAENKTNQSNQTEQLPIEVGIEKAKNDIINAINYIGQAYNIPVAVLSMIINEIADEAKIASLSEIIIKYDISSKEKPEETKELEPKVIDMRPEFVKQIDPDSTGHVKLSSEEVEAISKKVEAKKSQNSTKQNVR